MTMTAVMTKTTYSLMYDASDGITREESYDAWVFVVAALDLLTRTDGIVAIDLAVVVDDDPAPTYYTVWTKEEGVLADDMPYEFVEALLKGLVAVGDPDAVDAVSRYEAETGGSLFD